MASVEVVLDSGDATGAFFLSTPEDSGPGVGPEEVSRRFALTLSNRMTVLARFGPFSVRQTVYASGAVGGLPHNASGDGGGAPEAMGDVTAHLVTAAPRRDRPTLRMLFHTGSEVGALPVACSTDRRVKFFILGALNCAHRFLDSHLEAQSGETHTSR